MVRNRETVGSQWDSEEEQIATNYVTYLCADTMHMCTHMNTHTYTNAPYIIRIYTHVHIAKSHSIWDMYFHNQFKTFGSVAQQVTTSSLVQIIRGWS